MKPKPRTKRTQNVGVSALARECGMAYSTVSKQLTRGLTADQIRQRAHAIKGTGTPPAAKKTAQEKSEYDQLIERRSKLDQLEDAKLRRADALAVRQELDNMVKRGELVPIAYIRLWAIRFLVDGRDELLKGPSELADTLAAEDDPKKIAAILTRWLERALAKFSQLETLWARIADQKVA
jgi:hypothetical protein